MSEERSQALVIGAGGGIGGAMVERWVQDERFDRIWSVSRAVPDVTQGGALKSLVTDHSEADIQANAGKILEHSPDLSRIVIALGTLHGDNYQPEKSLEALSADAMLEVARVNYVLPMLWLAALAKGLRKVPDCRIAVLSARVGSIGDNGLGGWYSYRSAKAALNMGLRSAAIELARRAKGVKLIAYHPGTVDTGLSAPFQRGVPEGKLFTREHAAACLDGVIESQRADGELAYLDWAGNSIPW